MKKRMIAAMLTAMTALSVFGVTAMADDDELVLFTWENMFPQEVLDGFTEETGIKVVYSNFDTDETMLEKLSQAKGGDYDVIVADDYIIEQAVSEGACERAGQRYHHQLWKYQSSLSGTVLRSG